MICGHLHFFELVLVGKTGFEPATPWSQTRCATGLRYFPIPPGLRRNGAANIKASGLFLRVFLQEILNKKTGDGTCFLEKQ